MPLSEQEQRLLDEMERSLYQSDAAFVAKVGARRGRASYTAIVSGILIAVAGIAVVVAGVTLRQPLVGVLGFVVMFVGVLLAFGGPRRDASSTSRHTSTRDGAPSAPHVGFMDRMNDRWEKRQGDMGR